LGFVETFDPISSLFRVRGLEWAEVSAYLGVGLSDDLIETALALESLEEWVPFAAEDRAVYQVSRQKRDAAFRSIVLANLWTHLRVTGQRFHSQRHVEADGAHIIGKEVHGHRRSAQRHRTFKVGALGIRSRNLMISDQVRKSL